MPGRGAVAGWRQAAVPLGDAAPAAALEHGVDGDEPALLEDLDLGGGDLHFDRTAAGAVGDGVEIAAD